MVNVHDLTVFAPITSLEKARGATMFVLDLQVKYLKFEVFKFFTCIKQRRHRNWTSVLMGLDLDMKASPSTWV